MRFLCVIMCIIVLFLGGCSQNHEISNKEREEAKQTLINYIKAVNDNNYEEQLRYLSPSRVNMFEQNRIRWNMVPKYEYIRIIKITPDNSKKSKDNYQGPYDIIAIFQVDLEYKLTPNEIDPNVEVKTVPGKWSYTLIKEKENDPWKIDGWGY